MNIGDIAHPTGVLALIEKSLPTARGAPLGPANLTEEVMAMEHRRFPHLKIIKGTIGANSQVSNLALADALA